MKIKDVRKILDIPGIEDYLANVFHLDLYEAGDRTIIYKCRLPNRHEIVIDMNSEESLILGKQELADILVNYKIEFFQWVEFNDLGKTVSAFMYRPHVEESEKNY